MTVRAKFCVESILSTINGGEVALRAVTSDGSDEDVNKSWSQWTPSGELKMFITAPGVVDQFEIGKSYFLDFTPAD